MNRILACLLLGLCLVSCRGCSSTIPYSNITVAADPIDQQVSLDKVTATIPLGWVKMDATNSSAIYANKAEKNLIVLSKEECNMTYSQCLVFAIREIVIIGAELNSVDDIELNGIRTLRIEAIKDGVKLWTWLAYHEGNLYTLSCGGLETDSSVQDTCFKIASSFKLIQ